MAELAELAGLAGGREEVGENNISDFTPQGSRIGNSFWYGPPLLWGRWYRCMHTFGATLAGLWILTGVRNTAKSRFKDFRDNKPRARLARVLFGFASIERANRRASERADGRASERETTRAHSCRSELPGRVREPVLAPNYHVDVARGVPDRF